MGTDGETLNDAPPPVPSARRAADRRTVVFVAVFAISVFALLTGYRFLIGSRLNDWYLFQVAKNTVSALTLVGDSAFLEGLTNTLPLPPKSVRATLKAWERGETAPKPEEIAAESDAPLTEWEQYLFRIGQRRVNNPADTNFGPHVTFVYKPGLSADLNKTKNEIAKDMARGDDRDPSKKPALDALRARAADLLQRSRDIVAKKSDEKDTTLEFKFYVVSECGAIEVMAIFFSAVIAFPTSWRKRALGLAGGLPMMYALNIFRLTVLAVIGALDNGGPTFDFFHHFVWQAIYIVFVVGVWMLWIEFVVRGRKQ